MPRYVILSHDHPTPHWDLMLEAGQSLRTWRLARLPEAGLAVSAELIAPHRPMYLEYEGPVSGGRGSVFRWDAGTFDWMDDRPGRVEVALAGGKLVGRLTLLAAELQWVALFTARHQG